MKKEAKGSIHDENFKHNFSREDVGRDFLQYNLPKKVLRYVDINTLKVLPNEFLRSKYRGGRCADIIYELQAQGDNEVYILVHLEAQSKHDPYMSLRVWEYHTAIARSHLKKNKDKKIPLIVTFVLYNGKEEWKSAKSIAASFQDFELYTDISLKSPFLINLSEQDVEDLKIQHAAAAPQIIMKGKGHGDYCSLLGDLYHLMKKHEQVDDENIGYMATVDERGEETFLENLSKFDDETAKNYSNMFERALKKERIEAIRIGKNEGIQIGKTEGIQIGKSKGIQIGEQKGEQKALEKLVQAGLICREDGEKVLNKKD